MRIFVSSFSVLLILLSVPLAAAQQFIGVSFAGGSVDTKPVSLAEDEIAGVLPQSNWNNASDAKGTLTSLIDHTGKTTNAVVVWNASNTWSLPLSGTTPNDKLMKGYLDTDQETTTTVIVSKLPAEMVNAGYDVIVYCDGENSSGNAGTRRAKYKIGTATVMGTDIQKTDFSGTFTECTDDKGGNYVRFNGMKDAQFTLVATPDANLNGGAKRAPINAIQIVSGAKAVAVAPAKALKGGAGEWTSRDIGAGAAGGTTEALGVDGLEIKGAGNDIWNERDGFRYVYQVCKGDFDLRARVVSLENTNDWAKAGLMVRQSAAEDAIHVSVVATKEHGIHIQRRPSAGGASIDADGGATQFPNAWLRLVRLGNAVSCFSSGDGETWREIGGIEFPVTGPVLAGLCVSSHEGGRLTRAEYRNIALKTDTVLAQTSAGVASAEKPVDADTPRRIVAPSQNSADSAPTDPKLAAALAAAAAKLASDGKDDKARDMAYKALANDENCAEALYELGKLLEKGGTPTFAADFLARASRELARLEGSNPAMGTKRQDADRRLLKLNPYAQRLTALYADYATDLNVALKKNTDSLTQDTALDRIRSLHLADYVAPEKLPKIDKPVAAGTGASTKRPDSPSDFRSTRPSREIVTNVPVDVERALKAAGWTKITGTWKKKAENVYEVTDGKLEAPVANGAVQVAIQKGGTGVVRTFVRNSNSNSDGGFYSYGSGYGVRFENGSAKLFTPYNYSGTLFRPYGERDISINEALPKSQLLVTIMDSNLEISVNGKREHRSNYKLSKDGPVVIEVDGTMTIESPMVKGQ